MYDWDCVLVYSLFPHSTEFFCSPPLEAGWLAYDADALSCPRLSVALTLAGWRMEVSQCAINTNCCCYRLCRKVIDLKSFRICLCIAKIP